MNKEMQISQESDMVLTEALNLRFVAPLQHKVPFAEEIVNEVKNEQ